jgi:hypothetical protein
MREPLNRMQAPVSESTQGAVMTAVIRIRDIMELRFCKCCFFIAFGGNLGAGNAAGDVTMRDPDLNWVGDDVRRLAPHVEDLAAAGADGPTLKERLEQLNEELQKAAPSTSILRGLLLDVRNAIAGAVGNLIALGAAGITNQVLGPGLLRTSAASDAAEDGILARIGETWRRWDDGAQDL